MSDDPEPRDVHPDAAQRIGAMFRRRAAGSELTNDDIRQMREAQVSGTIMSANPTSTSPGLTFPGGMDPPAITIRFEGEQPIITIRDDLAWDTAAKHFWNAVCRMMGRIAPFPDIDV